MADHIFFDHGGSQARPNQSLESNHPFILLDGWTAPEDSCQLDQFLCPRCKVEQYHQPTVHEYHNKIYAPYELNQMIHRNQVLGDESVTQRHRNSNPDTASGLFDLLGSGPRKGNISSSSTSTVYETSNDADSVGLSTGDVFRIAGARFIQSYSKSSDLVTNLFDIAFSGLSDEQLRNVELAEFLLTAAEKTGDGQFERASNLLTGCDLRSSLTGDPVQRLVHCFSRALRERIDHQTGKEFRTVQNSASVHKIMNQPMECFLEFYEKKGEQWTIVFMHALASREENLVDHLKITSIGILEKDMMLEQTGKRLVEFAETMALPFSFKVIMVEDFTDLKEEMFEIDCEETVAVLPEYLFSTLTPSVEKVDHVMKVVWKLKPCVMVMTEVETNTSSPIFVNRFIETLFFGSAWFDCMEA
ncbi:DELLA protein 1 [Linum grandiflorum]